MIRIVLMALAICGCQSAPRQVTLPDGKLGHVVDCSGTRSDQADCMNAAAALCGGPYEVVSQNESTVGAVQVAPSVVGAAIRRSMIVTCGRD
jgi:hypothetical protein